MTEAVVMVCWGLLIGWVAARALATPPAPAVTREHEIGARMASIVGELIETQRFARRFTGHVMPTEKSWHTPSRFGTFEVVVRLHDDGPS